MCNAPKSYRAEIGPIELAIKCKAKIKKGFSVFLVTLNKIALGVVLHVVSYCVAISAHVVSHVVGCCMRRAAAYTALCVVGYYVTVIACIISRAMLSMLS